MGGLIALLLAQKNLVSGLVLHSPAPPAGINGLSFSVLKMFSKDLMRMPLYNHITSVSMEQIEYGVANSQDTALQKEIFPKTTYESSGDEMAFGSFLPQSKTRFGSQILRLSFGHCRLKGQACSQKSRRLPKITDVVFEVKGCCHWTIGGSFFDEIADRITRWHSKVFD